MRKLQFVFAVQICQISIKAVNVRELHIYYMQAIGKYTIINKCIIKLVITFTYSKLVISTFLNPATSL